MKFWLFHAVLVLALVCNALARELPFAANDRQAESCVGLNQRCSKQGSEECCGDLECDSFDHEYVDCHGSELYCHIL